MTYLLVAETDGRILAELEFLEDALEALERLRAEGGDVFLARFDDRPGEVFGTRSVVTLRVGDR